MKFRGGSSFKKSFITWHSRLLKTGAKCRSYRRTQQKANGCTRKSNRIDLWQYASLYSKGSLQSALWPSDTKLISIFQGLLITSQWEKWPKMEGLWLIISVCKHLSSSRTGVFSQQLTTNIQPMWMASIRWSDQVKETKRLSRKTTTWSKMM